MNSSKLGLNLVQSPSFLFTKNVALAQREVEEWFEELGSDKAEMLVVLFNDSGIYLFVSSRRTFLI